MCSERPCRCSCDLVRVADVDAVLKGPVGSFCIAWMQSGDLRYRQLWVKLPCEGGTLHGLPIRPLGTRETRMSWEWNEDAERPTLTPSVRSWRRAPPPEDSGVDADWGARSEIWHGWIRAGRAESC